MKAFTDHIEKDAEKRDAGTPPPVIPTSDPLPEPTSTNPLAPGWITALACLTALVALTVAMVQTGDARTLTTELEVTKNQLDKLIQTHTADTKQLDRWQQWRALAAEQNALSITWQPSNDSLALHTSCLVNPVSGKAALIAHELPKVAGDVHLFELHADTGHTHLSAVTDQRMVLLDSLNTSNWREWVLATVMGDSIPIAPSIVIGRPFSPLD